jgi:hypothetical protein
MRSNRSLASALLAGLTRQTAAFSLASRPAPRSFVAELWAGLTRNTPAFNGLPSPQIPVIEDAVAERQLRRRRHIKLLATSVGIVICAAVVGLVLVLVLPSAKHQTSPTAVQATPAAVVEVVALIGLGAIIFWRMALRIVLIIVVIALVTILASGAIALFEGLHH